MLQYLSDTPAFQRWVANLPSANNDFRFYQQEKLRIDEIICYIDILWPNFLEEDGMIIRESGRDTKEIKRQLKAGMISVSEAEYIINHVHVHDLFPNDPDISSMDERVFLFLAHNLSAMWKCRLSQLYPEKRFNVGVDGDDFEPSVFVYTIQDLS
jgi:hypothetical protein